MEYKSFSSKKRFIPTRRDAAIGLAIGMMAITSVMLPKIAEANSLKDLRARETEEKKLNDEIAFTSKTCETNIIAVIDWGKSGDWPAHQSLAQACDAALGAIEAACRAGNKAAVKKSVSRFSCSADKSGARLDNGVLFFGADATRNGFAITKTVLDKSL